MNEEITIEFSRPYNLELIKKSGTRVTIEASEKERILLADRFNIVAVEALVAECHLKKMAQKDNGDYFLNASFSAKIAQHCVLTLETLSQDIEENFSIIFKESQSGDEDKEEHREVEFELEEDDIEYIENKEVDLGGFVAEYLSLAINPYPKKKDVKASELGHEIVNEDEIGEEPKRENPFNVLKDLKHKT